jgi:xanthine/CO dehydrogenase XdhC/CoxF family maturation factor
LPARARELTHDHPAIVLSFDTSAGESDEVKPSLGCGGSIDVLVERLTPAHLEYLETLATAYDADVASLATCTIDASREPVRVTRVHGRCGGDLADLESQAMCDRRSYAAVVDVGRRVLVHYIPPVTRLVIFGGGDDVRPVCDLARSLGWHVTVADRRARRATGPRFPSADAVIAEAWDVAVRQIRFTAATSILLMTHSLPDDVALLPLLADKPCAYIGVLGPAHRRDNLLKLAADESPLDDAFIARLHGPIGLDLGDRSAGGIAVSVIAQIVAHLNERSAAPMSAPSTDADLMSAGNG